jgi:hypothetical protein
MINTPQTADGVPRDGVIVDYNAVHFGTKFFDQLHVREQWLSLWNTLYWYVLFLSEIYGTSEPTVSLGTFQLVRVERRLSVLAKINF